MRWIKQHWLKMLVACTALVVLLATIVTDALEHDITRQLELLERIADALEEHSQPQARPAVEVEEPRNLDLGPRVR